MLYLLKKKGSKRKSFKNEKVGEDKSLQRWGKMAGGFN